MSLRWILLCLTILPRMAFAESSLNFTPPGSDYSVVFLGNLFGVVDGVLHGTGSQIMGTMFGVFNAAVLALGGIVVMYTIIVGTMNTAHEGQMLGQKWSSIWVTVRSTIGLAFLVPKASGYCLMQIFIMWVVVQGVGAADKIWNAALDYLNRGGAIVKAQNVANSTTGTKHSSDYNTGLVHLASGTGTILQGLVCMKGLQTLLENQRTMLLKNADKGSGACSKQSLSSPSVDPLISDFCATAVPDLVGSVNAIDMLTTQGYVSSCDPNYKYSDATESYTLPMPNLPPGSKYAYLKGVCGSISWNDFNPQMSGISLSCSDQDMTRQSRAIAIQQVYSDLIPVASVMVDNDPQINTKLSVSGTTQYNSVALNQFGLPYMSSGSAPCSSPNQNCTNWGPDKDVSNQTLILTGFEFQNALADYNGIMLPALNLQQSLNDTDAANKMRSFISESEQRGWIMAGSYFFDLAYLNGKVTENSDLIDTQSGLEASSFSTSFTENPNLLKLFGGDSTPLTGLETLIDAKNLIDASGYTFDVSTTASAVTSKKSSSVNGYITNGAMVHLPGQPGLDAPTFKMNFNVQPGQSLTVFPKKRYHGFWAPIQNFFYNDLFRGVINTFVGFIVSVFDMVMQAVLYVPLTSLMEVFNNGVQLLESTMTHPIIALAYMGTAFINASVDVWLNLFASAIAFHVPTFGLVWIILIMILPFLSSWLGIMTSIGFIDAYYVPFVPYMIFTFGAIAWMMAVIESMVAGPIVALGVMHPEGHDALGKAEQAIMILINIFLRPAMMIIGYIGAIALSYVTVFLLNTGFVRIMQFLLPAGDMGDAWANMGTTGETGNQTGSPYYSWAAMYASFFCLVTYTSMYVTVVQKSFTLIYILPDKILRWMGSQGESFGQETAQWAEEAKGQTKDTGEATGKSSMKTGGSVMGIAESVAVGANKGASGGSSTAV